MKNAVIDIGSNSVRLNVFSGGQVIYRGLRTTRLGQGISVDGKIKRENLTATVIAVCAFLKTAEELGAKPYIFGTAACRNADNAEEFLDAVSAVTGKQVHVLSGEEEAYVGFIGGTARAQKYPSGIIDIGGASAEIAVGTISGVTFAKSIPVGAVRAYDLFKEDKLGAEKFVRESLIKDLDNACAEEFFAIGGTATSLAAILSGKDMYDISVTDGFIIEIDKLIELTDRLYEMGLEKRQALTMIDNRRAEIIACGAVILKEIAQKLRLKTVTVSETDNLFGYLKTYVDKSAKA